MNFEEKIREVQSDMLHDICRLVSIDSAEGTPEEGAPFGKGPKEALECALEMGKEMGFQVENVDSYAGHIDFGDGEEVLGILGHVDVVPAGDGWVIKDPFSPEVIDGKLYGRGVLDDKGPMLVCLYAMKILKEMGVPLKKKIRMIVGTNEETNWGCMEYYFHTKKVTPPDMAFCPDSNFPVTYAEKGVLQYQLVMDITEPIQISGGNAVNSVPETAEVLLPPEVEAEAKERIKARQADQRCSYTLTKTAEGVVLTVQGKAAHAARPFQGINAVTGLMEILCDLKLEGELGRIASFYMEKIGWDLEGKKIGVGLSDEESGKLTFSVGKIEVKEGRFVMFIDNRVPVTYTCSQAVELVKKEIEGSGFYLEGDSATESILVDKNSFLVSTLMKVYQDVTGDMESQPLARGGCTYARTMKNCVAFGAMLNGRPDVMHQRNEYIEVTDLEIWLRIYLEAIYRLAC